MKKLPSADVLEEIAIELGVDPSFVEKDWFAVELLTAISSIETPEIIFTGGTSLSKAYGLIQRFSEDLDFRIYTKLHTCTRGERKSVREDILDILREQDGLTVIEHSIEKGNESRFFSLNIEYPQINPPTQALRPHLKLEFSFEDTLLGPEVREIRSFVTQFTGAEYDCRIKTISPIETAADKFSALLWRVNVKDRSAPQGSPRNDPTIIRHLHDLAALSSILNDDSGFKDIIKASFERDLGRGGSDREKKLEELAKDTVEKLKSDPQYKHEYEQFVDAMSYAEELKRINFKDAISIFSEMIHFVAP